MRSGLASILYLLRTERGESQRKVAEELQISQAMLSHYENGIREPRLDLIPRICEHYKVSADYILGRTNEKQSVVLPCASEDQRRLAALARQIKDLLKSAGDAELCDSAARYFSAAAASAVSILRDAEERYDPMRDVELKMAEADFRRRRRRTH